MNRRNILLISGAVIGVGALLIIAAFAMTGFRPKELSTTETVEESRTFEEAISGIDIQTVASDVRFERSNDGKTRVESRHDAQIEETVEVKSGVLTVRQKQARKGINIGIDLSSEDDRLTVYLPQSAYQTLGVETVSGEITLGELQVERASLNTVSGEIELQNLLVSGKMTLNTVSGDIELDRCDADKIEIGTVSGEVEGTLLSGKTFDVGTTSGEISVPASTPGAGLCEIGTVSGDVSLRVVD